MHSNSGAVNSGNSSSFQKQFLIFEENETFRRLINILPCPTIVCNEKRQVVYFNQKALDFLGQTFLSDILGLRIGDVFNCINAAMGDNFCGESEKCQFCEASHSFIDSQLGKFSETKCVIEQKNGETISLNINSNPYLESGSVYSLISFKKTFSKNKSELFENIFLHDILNTAGNIQGCLEVYPSLPKENQPKLFKLIQDISTQLIDEINYHQSLVSAEYESLKVRLSSIVSLNLLIKLAEIFNNNSVFADAKVELSEDAQSFVIQTDETLLFRVLQNLIKNALEAGKQQSKVVLNCCNVNGEAKFTIHNRGEISPCFQSEIFKENTSSKSLHRGLGLHSVKLLTHKYLKGKVTFSSAVESGTSFFVNIPLVQNFNFDHSENKA